MEMPLCGIDALNLPDTVTISVQTNAKGAIDQFDRNMSGRN
jgi:hypothetical protein